MSSSSPIASGLQHAPDAEAQEDVRLVAALVRGDRAALAAIYRRHARQMLAVGARIFGQLREAEDVLHDVFVEVQARAAEYDPQRGPVARWLLMRMRSRSLDRARSIGYRGAEPLSDREDLPAGRLGSPDLDPLEYAPDRRRVLALLAALSDEHRAVVDLSYFRGLSSREVARQLGIPVGTVKSRMRAALGRLREALAASRGAS